jgi:MYXO-CTERM domain-containing protein
LRLTFDGQTLASRDVPIGVDRWMAEGEPLARGGCSLTGRPARSTGGWPLLAAALLVLRRRFGRR